PAGGDRCRNAGIDRLPGNNSRCEHFVVEPHRSRTLLHRAERVARLQREAVDIGTVEARHVDRRDDIVRQDSVERFTERNDLLAEWREPQMFAKSRRGLVPGDDGEKLRLPRWRLRGLSGWHGDSRAYSY